MMSFFRNYALLFGVLLCFSAAPLQAGSANPNILFILADDLGYGDVSCYNPEAKVKTPHLDRLAREGMRFTDAHSPSTVCTPSRYSFLTGRMAFRSGNRAIFTGVGGPNMIEKGRLTLPTMLQQQGYTTALIGKWHVGLTFLDDEGKPIVERGLDGVKLIDYSRPIPDSPIHRGFDQFFGTACCPTTDWLYAFIEGDRIPVPPTKVIDKSKYPANVYTEDMRAGLIAPDFDPVEIDTIFLNRSLKFLDEQAKERPEQPFFLVHSTQAVHSPSLPAAVYQGASKAGPHGDFIAQFDAQVGVLLDKLDELDLTENALVMISSDNGPEVWSVTNMRKDYQHDGARPWRGVKRDQWEGGHRVPFIARWPKAVEAGVEVDQTVCLTDVMATCAGITGAKLPNDAAVDSFDLSPLLLGKTTKLIRPYTLHQTWTFDLAIRQGDWKYLDHQGSGGNNYKRWPDLDQYSLPEKAPKAPGQLYNLAQDAGETENLYFEHPDKVRELKALLEASKQSGRSAPVR